MQNKIFTAVSEDSLTWAPHCNQVYKMVWLLEIEEWIYEISFKTAML